MIYMKMNSACCRTWSRQYQLSTLLLLLLLLLLL
jgi:hypothetical protein